MGQVLCFCLLMLPIVAYSMWAEWNYEKTAQRSQLLHTAKALAARQTALIRGSESLCRTPRRWKGRGKPRRKGTHTVKE